VRIADTAGLFTYIARALRVDDFCGAVFYLNIDGAIFTVDAELDIIADGVFRDYGVLPENHYTIRAVRFQQACRCGRAAYHYGYYYGVNSSEGPHQ